MKKIVVIGAGPAGLTAAYELLKAGYSVTVLEASDRIGGICTSVQHGGCRMDLGGHRLFSKDERITEWWKQIMPLQGAPSLDDKLTGRKKRYPKGGADPERTDSVLLIRERSSHIYYKRRMFDYPLNFSLGMLASFDPLTAAKVIGSYLYYSVRKLPETNLENFYINRFGRVLYSMFFESYTQKLWGKHPRCISADWGVQRVKGISITTVAKDMLRKLTGTKSADNTETSLIEQFWYPKLGSGQLWETVAQRIREMGGRIVADSRVTGFRTENGRLTHAVCGDRAYAADEFISSMPLSELVNALPSPESIRSTANGLPYRELVVLGLLVDRIELKNRSAKPSLGNILPDVWIYVQDRRVKLGRIQIFNNWSPYIVKDPQRTVWLGLEYFCSKGDEIWEMSEKQLLSLALGELCRIGVLKSPKVLGHHAEHVEKAYPAYFGTYSRLDTIKNYLDGFDNLWCVGRNGQHRYNNMDHSMMTAILAAQAIKQGSRDKAPIWSVNTDKAYHEHR